MSLECVLVEHVCSPSLSEPRPIKESVFSTQQVSVIPFGEVALFQRACQQKLPRDPVERWASCHVICYVTFL